MMSRRHGASRIERHILIVEVPEDNSPSRGDLENCIHDMHYLTIWDMISLEHPGYVDLQGDKIVFHDGEWKRGHEYVYGPNSKEEKLEQNVRMIKAMSEAVSVMREENAEIRASLPGLLEHYSTKSQQVRTE